MFFCKKNELISLKSLYMIDLSEIHAFPRSFYILLDDPVQQRVRDMDSRDKSCAWNHEGGQLLPAAVRISSAILLFRVLAILLCAVPAGWSPRAVQQAASLSWLASKKSWSLDDVVSRTTMHAISRTAPCPPYIMDGILP